MGRKYYIDPNTGEKIYIRDKTPSLAQYRKASDQDVIDAKKTEKTRIDFDGEKFTLNGSVLNYKQLYDIHLEQPDFAFIVYGDRAYLLSYVQDDPSAMRELRFESVIAVTSDNLSYTKTSGIYVLSSDGVNIANVTVTDINSENKAYKATEITDSNKNNATMYPSVKATADYVNDAIEDLIQVEEKPEVEIPTLDEFTELEGTVNDIKEDLTRLDETKLTEPESMAVGKYFRVSAIDEKGHAVLEAVDLPKASESEYGLVKTNEGYGTSVSYGNLAVYPAAPIDITRRDSSRRPIVPTNLVTAVDSVLCSTAPTEQLTAEQQLAGRQRLGLDKEWVLKGTLTTENKNERITVDLSGCTEMMIVGSTTATGESLINIIPSGSGIIGGGTRDGYRFFIAVFRNLRNGFCTEYARYSNAQSGIYLSNNLATYDYFKVKIGSITKIYFERPDVVTTCDIQIFAR